MVKVTELQYSMEPALVDKLNLMIKRSTGKSHRDNVLLIDGNEGDGKSNMETGIAKYVAYKTGRGLTLKDNMYFDLDKLIDFALKTSEQIIMWDEGALGGLAIEWWKKNQVKFMKMLMVCRKKRHFFIICIPKFYKLSEYLALDRSIGLIHVYSKQEVQQGSFVYFNKQAKERLYENWRRKRTKQYKKYYTFRGKFVITLNKIFNEVEYDRMKDEAILSIGNDKNSDGIRGVKKELITNAIKKLKELGIIISNEMYAKAFDCSSRTILRYVIDIRNMPKELNQTMTSRQNYNLGDRNNSAQPLDKDREDDEEEPFITPLEPEIIPEEPIHIK